MADINWGQMGEKYGPRMANWGWRMYNQPNAAYAPAAAPTAAGGAGTIGASGTATGAGLAGGYGSAAAGAGTGVTMAEAGGAAAGGSLGGMGAVGMTAGGAFSLVAPLIAGYMAYTAGSGVNEPVKRKYQTLGSGALIKDKLAGKDVDPSKVYEEYGLDVKKLPDWMDPKGSALAGESYTPGNETIDPRGYSVSELYDKMHRMGRGHTQEDGTGSSGYSDEDIDTMFGNDKGALAKGMGLERLPNWSGRRWDDSYESGFDPMAVPVKKSEGEWNALDESGRRPYEDQARNLGVMSSNADMTSARELWQRQQDQAEIEKMLGYRFRNPVQQV